jgi:beta-lactamase class A
MKRPFYLYLRLSRALAVAAGLAALLAAPVSASSADDPITAAARKAETALGGRLGLMIVDTETGRRWQYQAQERFAMASTFKVLTCAALLEAGDKALSRRIRIEAADILDHSPVTSGRVGESMTAEELCGATLRTSDNTAANLVLQSLGGPKRVTSFLRSIGDTTTRLDRMEPWLNEARPGDPRDTTTPEAMAQTIGALLLGDGLSADGRSQLSTWMEANSVSDGMLRAGVPSDWRVADRSGAGGHGTRGIVAVMWPPGRRPIIAAIYLTGTGKSLVKRDAAIAEIGRAIAAEVMR